MLFNNPAFAGQCDPAAGVPIPKALSLLVPGGMGPWGHCQCLSLSSAELLSLQLLSCNKEEVL